MSNRGALIVAAALTAFVLVVAGGIAGRLSKPAERAGAGGPAKAVVASRIPAPGPPVTRAMQTWRDGEDDPERRAQEGHRHVDAEHEDDDD